MDWFLYDNGLRHERDKTCRPTKVVSVKLTGLVPHACEEVWHQSNNLANSLNRFSS